MAQKAKWQSFYKSPTAQGWGGLGLVGGRDSVSGVWDQYSNVYYGEVRTKDAFLKPLKSDLNILGSYLGLDGYGEYKASTGNSWGYQQWGTPTELQQILGLPGNNYMMGIGGHNSDTDMKSLAQTKYDELNTLYTNMSTADYKYQDMMQQSVRQYGQGWGDYFEASYRNPRMAEEQRQSAQMKTDQYKAQVEEANNKAQLTSANQLEIQAPREVNTGVGSGRDTQINQLINNGGTGLGL